MKTYLKRGISLTIVAGILTTAASAGIRDHVKERFKVADGNGDGVVTHAEMMATVHKKFGEFDKNRDGFLELTELPKQMPMPPGAKERMEKRLEKMAKRNPEMTAEMKEHMEERLAKRSRRLNFVAKLDRDGDERVSVDEFAIRKIRHFKKADQNGDGSVTIEEAESAMKNKKHEMRRKMRKMRQ